MNEFCNLYYFYTRFLLLSHRFSAEESAAFISAVATMRNEKMGVASLHSICMRCMAENESLFLTPAPRDNPFQCLRKDE